MPLIWYQVLHASWIPTRFLAAPTSFFAYKLPRKEPLFFFLACGPVLDSFGFGTFWYFYARRLEPYNTVRYEVVLLHNLVEASTDLFRYPITGLLGGTIDGTFNPFATCILS